MRLPSTAVTTPVRAGSPTFSDSITTRSRTLTTVDLPSSNVVGSGLIIELRLAFLQLGR
jgi:hypothetical protein